MKLSKLQLRRIIQETVKQKLNETGLEPPERTSLTTRSTARAASRAPGLEDAVLNLIGEVEMALTEMLGSDDVDVLDSLDQSLHTDFHNDLMDFINEWMNTYTQEYEEGEFGP